jgi:hypothetical protein
MLINQLRIKVYDYYESFVNEFDILTETLLNKCTDGSFEQNINDQRQAFINVIRKYETINLEYLNLISHLDEKSLKKSQTINNI